MKVVQVVPRYPPRTGGIETHVKEVSERLVERGHDVTVLTADDGEEVRTSETRNGVRVIRHRGFAPNGAFHVAPGILQTLRRRDPDIVHTHNYHSLPLLFAAIGTRDAGFVATPHYHGGSASSFRDRLLSLYRPAGAWALRQADAVIAVSDWEREQLQRDFGLEATVIPNGVDVERFRTAEPTQREQPYLLTVGRLEEYKGVQHGIRALVNLPEYELVVAGSGEYGDRLREVAREVGVGERVSFLGYVDGEELPGLYAGAEVHLVLSAFEAYGMTVGEALAAGTPCVVRECGALVDWVGREGCVGVADVSPAVVARAVGEAVGRETDVDGLPTWEELVDRVVAAYG
ncbi:glycosyl transferase [Halorubrum sp. Ib24]|uniref:glycosyltransferase family 4 protein n=1 Tax=Halorubrum sp. Ib24 TaxID=1383850 RepID=UPI000B986707|nr:glycosyltransferase family 4 protein [Halorubrum sp. Ib24]OYR38957.1 glycosyl transferase [Halorubrum sp. Ib24]